MPWSLYGLYARKPVFGIPDKVNFKSSCSATETSAQLQRLARNRTLLKASLERILFNKRMTKALGRCSGWFAPLLFTNSRRQGFLHPGPYHLYQSCPTDSILLNKIPPGLRIQVSVVITTTDKWPSIVIRERSGSVVECLTRDRRAAGSSLTSVTALWSLSKTHLS